MSLETKLIQDLCGEWWIETTQDGEPYEPESLGFIERDRAKAIFDGYCIWLHQKVGQIEQAKVLAGGSLGAVMHNSETGGYALEVTVGDEVMLVGLQSQDVFSAALEADELVRRIHATPGLV